MSALFHRNSQSTPPRAVTGEGCYLIDAAGKRYLDACGGAAVSCLGHSDAAVRAAMQAQLETLAFAHTGFFTTEPAERMAETLVAHAPGRLARVYPVSGGSEAIEAALKLARQYFLEIGEPQRHRIIARRQSYHGNTLGALGAGGNMGRRTPFAPMMVDTSHIAPCYAYRDRAAGESLYAYGQRAANALEAEIVRLGPETVMAFIAEPVVGATAGAVPAVEGYLRRIREICDAHGILLIFDEIMCGMGRTGYLFACEEDGVAPDIVTIAKGLGAGYQPIGALLCTDTIHDAIASGSGFFQHGHTYLGHPMACAAANAVLARLTDGRTLSRVRAAGAQLHSALAAQLGQNPHVGDIRGRGLFRGIELVANRETKAPFDPSPKLHARIKANAMRAGLMCYPMGGTIDGVRGDHILLAPPFIVSDAEISTIADLLTGAIETSLAEIAAPA
ncbi:MAG: aspartate aminotransferase family protein [Pseudomonadota bacterium]